MERPVGAAARTGYERVCLLLGCVGVGVAGSLDGPLSVGAVAGVSGRAVALAGGTEHVAREYGVGAVVLVLVVCVGFARGRPVL